MAYKKDTPSNSDSFIEYFKSENNSKRSIKCPSWLADIGKTLRAARAKQSQSEIRDHLGIPRSVISSIENGRYDGSLKALIKYLDHYDFELIIQKKKRELSELGDNE